MIDIKQYSSVLKLGVTQIERYDSPPYKSVVFPQLYSLSSLEITPNKKVYDSMESFGKDIDQTLTSHLIEMTNSPRANYRPTVLSSHSFSGDFYRLISAVEESNAEFSGFIVPKCIKQKTILNQPAEQVDINYFIGGMWSNAILLITKYTQFEKKIEVWWGIGVRHYAAFAVLQ